MKHVLFTATLFFSSQSALAWMPEVPATASAEAEQDCADLSGVWIGTCEETRNGEVEIIENEEMKVEQTRCDRLRLDDEETFNIGAVKQVTESSDTAWFQTTSTVDLNAKKNGFEGSIVVHSVAFGAPKTTSETSGRIALHLNQEGLIEATSSGKGFVEAVFAGSVVRTEFDFLARCTFHKK